MSDNSTNPDQPLKVEAGKNTYTPPRLTRFGPVQGLTLGSGGTKGDGQLGMTRGNNTADSVIVMGMGMGMN